MRVAVVYIKGVQYLLPTPIWGWRRFINRPHTGVACMLYRHSVRHSYPRMRTEVSGLLRSRRHAYRHQV